MIKTYSSKLAPLVEDYLEFRAAMGRSMHHAGNLRLFDRYCLENHPELEHLSREAVRGWISDEIARGRGGLQNKAAAIRVFAKYLGNGAYILPTNTIPKKQAYSPYILTDEELAALLKTADTLESAHDPFLRETVSVLWRLLYTCGLSPLFSLVHDFFKIYLPNERKYSPNTIRAYQKSLELLLDFVKEKREIPLNKITFEMIDRQTPPESLDYLDTERGCSTSTRNHRPQCIRAFYNYAADSDVTTVAHMEEIKKVDTAKEPKKLVEHMSEAAVTAILAQPDTSRQKGLRDMFLMLFLYKTGARIQELLDVRLRDIQFGNAPRVTLHGKGAKTRNVPLRETVTAHLREYLKAFHPDEGIYSDQYLFFTERGGRRKRMSEDTARHFVHEYGATARLVCPEVPENVHPHLFRHSCAMSMYQNGVDLTLVSQWLGHANLETTLVYAHADTELKRKAIEKSVPHDSPLKEHINADRYKVDDDEMLKLLAGLK